MFLSMEWNSASLQEEIAALRERQGDSTEIEVKAAAGGLPHLSETICAFANMPDGGTIVLGLDESAGFAPVGIPNVALYEQGVASQARDTVDPPVRCAFQTFEVAGKPVLVVEIAGLPLEQRPARHGGKAYLRQSDGDYVMSEQELAQLNLLKTQAMRPTRPDRGAVKGTTADALDQKLLAAYLVETKAASRRYATAADEQVLRYTNVLTDEGEVTLAGLYALGPVPQTVEPSLGVTAAVQLPRTPDGPRNQDLMHMVGPIPDLLEMAMGWVRRNTRTTVEYDSRGHAVDRVELPMRAVREIVANALVHRNLDPITSSKRVEIRLRQDRLVITSPGGLWGVSQGQLGHPGAKSAVNQVLYDICKNVRLSDGSRVIEGEGGGIQEAVEALRDAGLRAPQFIDTGLQFTAIISRHTLIGDDDLDWLGEVADGLDLTSEERSILVSMRHGGLWTNARVRSEFAPMDSVRARRVLQRLVDTGLVEARGERGSTVYALGRAFGEPDGVPEVKELVLEQPPAPRAKEAKDVEGAVRHADRLLPLLTVPATLADLAAGSGLSASQTRYALSRLIALGAVARDGGQGYRQTLYRRV